MEVAMFSRNVSTHLNPIALRKSRGRLMTKSRSSSLAERRQWESVLWGQKENAGAYNPETYPQVLRALAKLIEGTPHIQTYEVSNSTFRKIAGHVGVKRADPFSFGEAAAIRPLGCHTRAIPDPKKKWGFQCLGRS